MYVNCETEQINESLNDLQVILKKYFEVSKTDISFFKIL